MQKTLKHSVSRKDVGLHSGLNVEMTIHPADADTNIVFFRSDVKNGGRVIPALWNRVVDTKLCTVIGNDHGVTVGTIEHVMAALRGCGIDNAIIELNGPEVPVMDGSSRKFVEMINEAGVQSLGVPRSYIRILKEVTYAEGDKRITLSPSDSQSFHMEIDFPHPSIGQQSFELSLVNGNFAHQVANCRTFGFEKEVAYLRSQNLALGGSLDNAIVLSDTGVLNPGGLRHNNEFVRHKTLDAVGDIALSGIPVLGHYHGVRAGHDMNNKILRTLFKDMNAFEIVQEGYGIRSRRYLRDEPAMLVAAE